MTFDDLRQVPWGALHGAHGSARDVPGLIEGLLDNERAPRCLDEVWDHLCHQGTRWNASAPAMPFLAHVVDATRGPVATGTLRLVWAIGLGPGWNDVRNLGSPPEGHDAPSATDSERAELRVLLARGDDEALERSWHLARRDAYDAFLALPGAAIRRWALRADTAALAVACLPYRPDLEEQVRYLIDRTAGDALRTLVVAWAHGSGPPDPAVVERVTHLCEDDDTATFLAAGAALLYRLGEDAPDEAVDAASAAGGDIVRRRLNAGEPWMVYGPTLVGFAHRAVDRLGWDD